MLFALHRAVGGSASAPGCRLGHIRSCQTQLFFLFADELVGTERVRHLWHIKFSLLFSGLFFITVSLPLYIFIALIEIL